MDNWQDKLGQWVADGTLRQATFSQLRRKDAGAPRKTTVRPILLKGAPYYQFEYHYETKVTHANMARDEAATAMAEWLEAHYRQALFKIADADVQLLFNKKGKAALLSKPAANTGGEVAREHDRQKRRVVPEGEAASFLAELGLMTAEGKVVASKQDKYRQINRFLEMVEDVLPHLPKGRTLRIVDFGCGKSYLTFALYHLLVVKQRRSVEIVGLDLKEDVIAFCSALAAKLGYGGLRFQVGDIARYEGHASADMVVTLHACDTATDAALAKAVEWGASVILSVPCCQHELLGQIENDMLGPLLSRGLLKERFAALATDAVRAQLLEVLGYKVQLLEFVDPEHTPKNMLIRAVAGAQSGWERKWEAYKRFRDNLQLSPYLEKALAERISALVHV